MAIEAAEFSTATKAFPNEYAHVEQIVAAQRAHRWIVALATAAERRARLQRLKKTILAYRGALYQAFHADFQKPQVEVEMFEIQPVLAEINHAIEHVEHWMRPKRARTPLLLFHAQSEVRHEPKGVALILAPWNYPFLLLIRPLVGAIAAGNCAVLWPSEKVPHVAAVMGQIIAACFPQNEVALVAGDIDVADALLQQPFDHFFFTGGGTVGRKVMRAAAEHLSSVTLELGGKSPAIVDQTADIALTAERLVWGRFLNAGQTCVSPDYVLVHESRRDAFLLSAKRAVARMYGANEQARAHNRDMPQIIDDRAFNRLTGLIRSAQAAGAHIETGGTWDTTTRRIAPTILSNVAPDNPIMAEEIFGPILPVLSFRTLEEAVALVASKDKPLALYIFSRDTAATEFVLAHTTAGGTFINNAVVHLANSYLPFGGVGPSGTGSYHGEYGFRTFSHERAVMQQSRLSFGTLFYPPYTRQSQVLARITGRLLYGVLPALRRLFRP